MSVPAVEEQRGSTTLPLGGSTASPVPAQISSGTSNGPSTKTNAKITPRRPPMPTKLPQSKPVLQGGKPQRPPPPNRHQYVKRRSGKNRDAPKDSNFVRVIDSKVSKEHYTLSPSVSASPKINSQKPKLTPGDKGSTQDKKLKSSPGEAKSRPISVNESLIALLTEYKPIPFIAKPPPPDNTSETINPYAVCPNDPSNLYLTLTELDIAMQDPYSYVDVSKPRYTPKSQHREPSREDAMKGRPLETADGYIMTSHWLQRKRTQMLKTSYSEDVERSPLQMQSLGSSADCILAQTESKQPEGTELYTPLLFAASSSVYQALDLASCS